jgi:capsid protein
MAVVSQMQVELAQIQFQNDLRLYTQQSDSRLAGTCHQGTHTGSIQASPVDYIAPMQVTRALPRGTHLGPQYADFQKRWVSPLPFELWTDVDQFDQLTTTEDPKASIAMAQAAAFNRMKDDVIIDAFFAAATIGPVGATTTETFNSGANFPASVVVADTVGVGSSTGMNIAKLLAAQEIFGLYDVDPDAMIHLGMTPKALTELMQQTQFTSTDFRNTATFDQMGRPKSFMNFIFHYSNRYGYDPTDSTERWLPAWVQDGMHIGVWADVSTTISHETDITGQPWRAYSKMSMGATRLQGGLVVRIEVQDTNGGPIIP